MDGETLATFLGIGLTIVVFVAFGVTFLKIAQSSKQKQRMEQYKQKKAAEEASSSRANAEQGNQSDMMKRIAQSFGLHVDDDDKARKQSKQSKHAKHVEDTERHGHVGEEEHYEEIVGSLGEINDEGCADLSGVRFLAHDMAYEIHTQNDVDYDRLAQAMVLGEIVNAPRFKTPYTRRK